MSEPEPGRPGADPAREGIYRAIQILLFLDVVLGLALAIAGEWLLEVRSVAYAGLGLAVVGLVLMVFFRALAQRDTAKRTADAGADTQRQRLRRLTGGDGAGDGGA